MKQESVSRVEKRADVLISTLDGYLRALGGSLRLVADFKDRAPVELTGFGEIKHLQEGPRSPRTSRAGARTRVNAKASH